MFVLGVYASAVHAKWVNNGRVICNALAVASEPEIFWDGNAVKATDIISKINIPKELGCLLPADACFNGPSGRVLRENILSPLGYTREEAWLCDLIPEARLNEGQQRAIKLKYDPNIEHFTLNKVTIPKRPELFCDGKRAEEISAELAESGADTLILLGDIPISQYLCRVAETDFSSLREHTEKYGYGNPAPLLIGGRKINVIPLAHPRQIGGLGSHSERWYNLHKQWEDRLSRKDNLK